MTRFLLSTAAAAWLCAAPAAAQSMGSMPGMAMPAKPKAAPPRKAPPKPRARKPMQHAAPAAPKVDHDAMPGMAMPEAPEPAPQTGMSAMPGMDHGMAGHAMAGHTMTAALSRAPATREASGTSWQPDSSRHMGLMTQAGDWMLMGHATLNLVADTQGGRRGADKLFASGMLMGMAQRPIGGGTLQFKAMVSPDPLMGKAGYPLLLASGETADGVHRLIDRQHPHDLFMELSASVSQPLGRHVDGFVHAALPGEPAFGPPAFMHRESIMDSPEAPISHHWLDSTHISFGVVTAGLVAGPAKIEVSRFNGREPDQRRYNIETGPPDSTAVRLSLNPTRNLSLQASWGRFVDPEQLEPGVDQKRLSASAIYTRDFADGTHWASTAAWGRKTIEGHGDNAFVLESSLARGGWTAFGRAEMTENRELLDDDPGHDSPAFRVGKASLGVVRDVRLGAGPVMLGVGALGSVNFIPAGLAPQYGGRHQLGAMAFVRLKVM